MKIASDPSGAQDTDSRRQNAVERTGKVGLGNGRRQCERCHLAQRVDACVGAAGALRQHFFAGNAGLVHRAIALHGQMVGLHLPAVEVGTVIGSTSFHVEASVCIREFPSRHGRRLRITQPWLRYTRQTDRIDPTSRERLAGQERNAFHTGNHGSSPSERAKTRVIWRPCRICHASS